MGDMTSVQEVDGQELESSMSLWYVTSVLNLVHYLAEARFSLDDQIPNSTNVRWIDEMWHLITVTFI